MSRYGKRLEVIEPRVCVRAVCWSVPLKWHAIYQDDAFFLSLNGFTISFSSYSLSLFLLLVIYMQTISSSSHGAN